MGARNYVQIVAEKVKMGPGIMSEIKQGLKR